MSAVRGCFIAVEGGEGAGKSTQAARLAHRLDAVLTREPGGTPVGASIRELFLAPSTGVLDARTEALLMAADRAQHVAAVVEPALVLGRHVVSDRSVFSSVAYQGYGRGMDPSRVRDLSRWATGGVEPDLVVLLDVPVAVARARLAATAPDRLEAEDDDFHERVRSGFLAQAGDEPDRWVVVDGTLAPDELAEVTWRLVEPLVGGR